MNNRRQTHTKRNLEKQKTLISFAQKSNNFDKSEANEYQHSVFSLDKQSFKVSFNKQSTAYVKENLGYNNIKSTLPQIDPNRKMRLKKNPLHLPQLKEMSLRTSTNKNRT